ncbi:MAG: FecR domain-containing protein [Candidatus Sulfotelmatobacter sp.]
MDMGSNKTENELLAKSGDYLWDGSGEPDPEIQRLETLLAEFRHDRTAPVFPEIAPDRRWTFFPWRMRLFPALVTATAAVLVIGAVTVLMRGKKITPASVAGWDVSRVAGTPRIGRNIIGVNEGPSRLGVGQILETDDHSRANLQAEDTGKIEMEPSTRLRLVAMAAGLKQLALDHGTIHAYIWAPAGQFVVNTPSAVTVDLGCAYTLQVDDSGAGLVRTSLGWVGFKLNGHESFIPAGAACATKPKVGPGTPYFEDASAELRAALARFDFEDSTPQQCAGDLAIVLAESRKHDALTLWHLLARVDEGQRALVYDRLRELAPPPAGVTREGVLLLDQPMLDLWWNALGFDDISVWRHWERSWSGAATPVREK